MKKKYQQALVLMTVLLCLTAGAVSARKYASASVENKITTGDVRISLREYAEQDGLRTDYVDGQLVQPSEQISKIPVLTNEASAAYVRFRTENSGAIVSEAVPEVSGITKEWIRIGSWYYRITPLSEGESCELFQAVVVPEEWTEEEADRSFSVTVIAEAIQAANFEPDYAESSPWKDLEIQTCIHENGNQVIQSMKTYSSLRIELDEDAEQLITIPEDFFSNLAEGMPGDRVSDQVQMKNRSTWPAELFFSTALPESLSESEQLLLRTCRLKLSMGNTVLYEGPLYAEDLQEEISLGILKAGESKTLTFELELPEDCDNSFACLSARTIWKFQAAWEETASSSFGTVPVSGSSYSGLLGSLAIRTGLSEIRGMLLVGLILITTGVLLFLKFRKERNHN